MKRWVCYAVFVVLTLGMSGGKADAQGSLSFPTTREGILKSFKKLGGSKGIGSKSVPDGIVEDRRVEFVWER